MKPRVSETVNLHFDFPKHIKTIRLLDLLGDLSEAYVIRLWCHVCRFHYRDGVLTGVKRDGIERIIGWRGEPGRAADALLDSGFVTVTSDGQFCVPEWADYNKHVAETHEKMAKMRERKAAKRSSLSKPLTKSLAKSLAKSDSTLCKTLTKSLTKTLTKSGEGSSIISPVHTGNENSLQGSLQDSCPRSLQEQKPSLQGSLQGSTVSVQQKQKESEKQGSATKPPELSPPAKFSYGKFAGVEKASENGNGNGATSLEAPSQIFVETSWILVQLNTSRRHLDTIRRLIIPNEPCWTVRAFRAIWASCNTSDCLSRVANLYQFPVLNLEFCLERMANLNAGVQEFYSALSQSDLKKIESNYWMRRCLDEWTAKLLADGKVTKAEVEAFGRD
jgi:hypothetical protein